VHQKKGIVMVAHGLNVRPAAMLSLVEWFNSQGCDAFLIKLAGHYENSIDSAAITVRDWQEDMMNGYNEVKRAAALHRLPLFFLGYSLGGLLGEDMILSVGDNIAIDKQVLLAPATAIRRRTYLLKLVFWWKKLYLPSLTPAKYKANKGLSVNAYKIMLGMVAAMSQSPRRIKIPTLAVIDTRDELISYKKLLHFLNRFISSHYELVQLDSGMNKRYGGYHHLIINQETMGEANWKMFTEKMTKFLFG
jgi:esterase/lipase